MGQLIIEIPFNVTRRYQIEDAEVAADVLANLDKMSLGENPTREQLEDSEDLIAAEKSYAEEGRISFKELKAELGL